MIYLKEEDKALWSVSHKFDCAKTWNVIRTKANKVEWWFVVWFNLAIPRYSFVGWMVILNKLPTTDRLIQWGLAVNTTCISAGPVLKIETSSFFNAPLLRDYGIISWGFV